MGMKLIIVIILLLLPGLGRAYADDPLRIFGTEIPRLFHSQKKGPYDALFLDLVDGFSTYRLTRMPMRRAQQRFLIGEADCLFVASNDQLMYMKLGMPKEKILLSQSVNNVVIRVFTRTGEEVVSNLSELHGKTVAIDFGAGTSEVFYKRFHDAGVTILPVAKLEQAFSLLKQGRVAGIVAFDFDVDLFLARNPAEAATIEFDPAYKLDENSDAIVCWRSPVTEAFIKHVDKRLEALKAESPEQSALRE